MEPMDPERQRLLATKLGDLCNWQVPEVKTLVGPHDPSVFHEFDGKLQAVRDKCKARLLEYTDAEVRALCAIDGSCPEALRKEWDDFAALDVKAISHETPTWHAAGFGHPDHQADFGYWARMPNLTLSEATCLSIGISPKDFPHSRLEDLAKRTPDEFRPPLAFLMLRYEQMQRQFGRGIRDRSIRTKDFLAWALRVEFDVHPEFLALLRRFHGLPADDEDNAGKPISPNKREIDKIAQVLLVMAIDGYGFDPHARRSIIPREIADAAASMGIDFHPDTVRKYLGIGKSFLSPDWTKKES